MMITILYIIIFALLASLSAKIGVIYSLAKENISKNPITRTLRGIASGFMLGTVFLFLWPFSSQTLKSFGKWAIIGFIFFFTLDRFTNTQKNLSDEKGDKKLLNGTKIFLGQIIIYIIYGLALCVGFKMGTQEGVILALGIILHQYPESIHTLDLLKNSWPIRYAIIAAFLGPFIIPIGTAISLFLLFAPIPSFSFLAPASGITGSLLIYLGATNMTKKTDSCLYQLGFGIGAIVLLMIKGFVL